MSKVKEPWKELDRDYEPTGNGFGYDIDREVAAKAECSNCGKVGLQYKGFVRQKPHYSYIAWIVCPMCEECNEL